MKRELVTIVCTGNTCRSPMGEGLLRHALSTEDEPLRSIKVQSAGIAAVQNGIPSRHSVEAMARTGIDINNYRGKLLTQGIVDRSFAVFCMTSSHCSSIRMQFEELSEHLYLMRGLMGDDKQTEILDPIGLSLADYEICRDSMAEAIPSIVEFLRKEYRI